MVLDDNAITVTLSGSEVNAILWMVNQRRIVIGTSDGVWSLSSEGPVYTPTDIFAVKDVSTGAACVGIVQAGNRILYVHRAKEKLIEAGFSWEDDAYKDANLSQLARHITSGGLKRIAYQEEPNRVVWAIRNDGVLLAMTYNREEDVVGWSKCHTDGLFEDVAVIPGANGEGQVKSSADRDEVWVIVKRTIDGEVKRYIEVFERSYNIGHAQEDVYYSDSLITYSGDVTTIISGLDHLEGKTVKIWGDGALLPDAVVTNGSIELDTPVNVAQVGLPYTHTMKSLKIEYGGQIGTTLGRPKRISALIFFLLNCHTLSYGPSASELSSIDFREVSAPMDAGVPFYSGEWAVDFEAVWETDARIVIESEDPVPFTLLAIGAELNVNE
mgnify:CR=1 FL=1